MAKVAGSIWVEGTDWHYVDASGNEWTFTGDYVSTPSGAVKGSFWIEGSEFHYIDANGAERRITGPDFGAKTGLAGSLWVESTWWAWLDASQHKHQGHGDGVYYDYWDLGPYYDIPHEDHSDYIDAGGSLIWYDHGDSAHGDVPHQDQLNYSDHDDRPVPVS